MLYKQTSKNTPRLTIRQEVGPLKDKPAKVGFILFLLTDCRVLQNHGFYNGKTTLRPPSMKVLTSNHLLNVRICVKRIVKHTEIEELRVKQTETKEEQKQMKI